MKMPSPLDGAKLPIRILAAALIGWLLVGCASREERFERRFREANAMVDTGAFAEAIEILVLLNDERPDHAPVVEALAFAYAGEGEHTLAAWHMIQLADLEPGQTDLRLLAAESLETAADLTAAIEQYRIYLETNSRDAQAWNHLAHLYRETGYIESAVEALLSKQTLDPSEETAFTLAELFRQLNNLPQAQVWYATTIRQGGTQTDAARLNLLELSVAEDDLESAERLVASLENRLEDPAQLERLNEYRKQIDAWKASLISMRKAREEQLRLAAEVERLRAEQESIARENERRRELDATAARREMDQAASEDNAGTRNAAPDTSVARPPPGPERDGDALALRGDGEGAVIAYWKAVAQDDSSPRLWLKLSNAYRTLRQWAEAEACILEARRRDRNNPAIEIVYLDIVRQNRPYDQFIDEVQTARSRFPQNPDMAILLADALAATGLDPIRAIRAYEDFLLLAPPQDSRRQQAQNTLDRVRGW